MGYIKVSFYHAVFLTTWEDAKIVFHNNEYPRAGYYLNYDETLRLRS
jgi:hypothetical protein